MKNKPGFDKPGLIFNIQKFSVHDGPGIRTTVFMKGCPLRCQWCANPESQWSRPMLMVRDIKCQSCGKCAEACPAQAITWHEQSGRQIDWEKCTQCLQCVETCSYGSLGVSGRFMSIEEVINEAAKDEPFYRRSQGGVTISGGEPFSQSDFVLHLLMALKEKRFHTALDTSGYVSTEVLIPVLQYTDLVLFDIKHLETTIHKAYTGVGNELILTNASEVSKRVRTWLRVPVIPGFNDSPEHISQVAELAKRLGVEKISLLPYHEGGYSKSHQVGLSYALPETRPPAPEHIEQLHKLISNLGITVTIGN